MFIVGSHGLQIVSSEKSPPKMVKSVQKFWQNGPYTTVCKAHLWTIEDEYYGALSLGIPLYTAHWGSHLIETPGNKVT